MKNMYLAAAMVVPLAFSACSDEESGKADRAYKTHRNFWKYQ